MSDDRKRAGELAEEIDLLDELSAGLDALAGMRRVMVDPDHMRQVIAIARRAVAEHGPTTQEGGNGEPLSPGSVREAVARALAPSAFIQDEAWSFCDAMRADSLVAADAALAALRPGAEIGRGLMVVPMEPDPQMIAAAWKAFRGGRKGRLLGPGPAFVEATRAMLAAAKETTNVDR